MITELKVIDCLMAYNLERHYSSIERKKVLQVCYLIHRSRIDETQSVFEKSFQQPARLNLRYILPSFSCRSSLRRPHSGKISHKLRRASRSKNAGVFLDLQIRIDYSNVILIFFINFSESLIILFASIRRIFFPLNRSSFLIVVSEVRITQTASSISFLLS